MLHIQDLPNGWDDCLALLPAKHASIKAVDNVGVLVDAKQKWAALGRDPRDLHTVYRHWNLDFVPFNNRADAEAHVWAMLWRFIDRTWLEHSAAYVDAIQWKNEYFNNEQSHHADRIAPYVLDVAAADHIWNTHFRGRVVHSPDGGEGFIPAHCRLIFGTPPVTHDVPYAMAEIAVKGGHGVGYNGYWRYNFGVEADDNWPNHAGRHHAMEARWGLEPDWYIGEAGPYDGTTAGGWRAPTCLGSDRALLVAAMRRMLERTQTTAAYRQGRIKLVAMFTSINKDWPHYNYERAELMALAPLWGELWHPGQERDDMDTPEKRREIAALARRIIEMTGEPLVVNWWDSLPEGAYTPPGRALAVPNKTIQFYRADGTPLLSRHISWVMWVLERRGDLLLVFNQDGTAQDWWCRAGDVSPA